MERLSFLLRTAALFVGCLVLYGCATRTYTLPSIKPTAGPSYAPSTKVPLAVELRLSPDYRDARWVGKAPKSDTFEVPFGDALVAQTEKCASAVFSTVIPTSSAREASLAPGAGAVLIPRVVSVDRVFPFVFAIGDQSTTMTLEWSLSDAAGRLIWIDTFKARTPPHKGLVWQNEFDELFRWVFTDSYTTMAASPDIRRYAERANASIQ